MTAPRYVSADVSGKGYLLRLDDLGSYEAIASGSINTMRDLARELTAPGPETPAEGPAEPRESQLDAMVIPGDVKARPELHADHRPDSYGHFEEFRGREHKLAPRIGFLPPDGTVPGR